jgi:hypothetical protein
MLDQMMTAVATASSPPINHSFRLRVIPDPLWCVVCGLWFEGISENNHGDHGGHGGDTAWGVEALGAGLV